MSGSLLSFRNNSQFVQVVKPLLVAITAILFSTQLWQSYAMLRIEQVRPYVERVDAESTQCRERQRAYWTGRNWNEQTVFFQKYAQDPIFGLLVLNKWADVQLISEVSWQSAKFDCE